MLTTVFCCADGSARSQLGGPVHDLLDPQGASPLAQARFAYCSRLTIFSCVQSFVAGNTRPGETLPAGVTFGIGALAGIVTVYATMPLE